MILFEKFGFLVVKKIKIGYLMVVDVLESLFGKYVIIDEILLYC